MQLSRIVASLIEGERDAIANMANTAAVLWEHLPPLNWAGFYITRPTQAEAELVLGPFQGKHACIRIPFGRGVCGTAAATRQTIIVPDVHAFADHIACDANSQSEMVVPIIWQGAVVAVIDLDSPELDRFTDEDARTIEAIAELLANGCDW
jgi:GAF domain-containing protein